MKQENLKILRYNTGTDKKAFVQFKDFFDVAIFNATIVAYSGSSVADLISMHSRKYIIDPQTHIFQQEVSAYTTESKKNHTRSIKQSVLKYLDQMPEAITKTIVRENTKPSPECLEANIGSLVECVYRFQVEYVNSFIQKKEYDKYLKFANLGPKPRLVIAPYFMIKSSYTSAEQELWLRLNHICLNETISLNKSKAYEDIAAQLVLEKGVLSEEFIARVTSAYDVPNYEYIFIWVDDFNSFTASAEHNELFSRLIKSLNAIGKKPVMAYGGYESIVLCNENSPCRLYGVAQSVGYGEYRPITPVGGGMPVNKYYFLPTHIRMRFDDVARILLIHGYFNGEKTVAEHANDYYNNICHCSTCHEVIGENINGFSIYNDSTPYEVKTKHGVLSKNRPTTDATLIAALHFLNCKVREWRFIEENDFAAVLSDLESQYDRYQPEASRAIKRWCNIYGAKED